MDSRDYDSVRNQTLLFFLEHLMNKGQSRTLHDLSCQFGTKGFTKEMRQIAGGSQAGLRKFLLQYPSLFTVDGDTVFVTSYTNGVVNSNDPAAKVAAGRDYAKEAVAYFSDKLKQYGPGTEVPIKSLLGHRSQAPPEIRHVSGQHIREFREFLTKFPEAFLVNDEAVVLKDHDGKVSQLTLPEDVKIDPNVTKEILNFLKRSIEQRGPTIVDQLFAVLEADLPRETWASFFKGASDLSTFLKMHSNVFQVQSHLVSLIKPLGATENKPKTSASSSSPVSPSKQPIPPSQQSVKQRLNSVLLKTLSENAGRDRVGCTPSAFCDTEDPSVMKALQSIKLIVSVKECKAVVDDLLSRPDPVYAIDGEGVNLGPTGPMTLLLLSTMQGEIFAFDIMVCKDLVFDGGLQLLLEDERVVKVMHDCRNDSAALSWQYGVTMRNVFDTQSAHAVLQHKITGRPVYKVKNLGLSTLCQLYEAPGNPKKEQLKTLYKRDQRYWARRPLTDDMLSYAAFDVIPLVPYIYGKMKTALTDEFMPLLEELCDEQVEHFIRRDSVRLKKKSRKAEVEIQELREKMSAVAPGKTLVLSNREIRLLRYMDLTDEEKEKLEGSQKVLKKLERIQNKNENREENREFSGATGDDSCPNSGNFMDGISSGYGNGMDAEFTSLDSAFTNSTSSPESSLTSSAGGVVSPRSNTASPNLTASMQMVDKLLANGKMDRIEKIERIEAILAAATANSGSQSDRSSSGTFNCDAATQTDSLELNPAAVWSKPTTNGVGTNTTDSAVQTLSTGEIVITKVHFASKEKNDANSPSGDRTNDSQNPPASPNKA